MSRWTTNFDTTQTQAIFTYINDNEAVTRQDNTVTRVRNALRDIENQLPIARG
jgi:hypothetical protein